MHRSINLITLPKDASNKKQRKVNIANAVIGNSCLSCPLVCNQQNTLLCDYCRESCHVACATKDMKSSKTEMHNISRAALVLGWSCDGCRTRIRHLLAADITSWQKDIEDSINSINTKLSSMSSSAHSAPPATPHP